MNALTKTLTASSPATMSSLEIAELTGKTHFHVMRDIRMVLEALGERASNFGGTIERPNPKGGRPISSPCFNLPKHHVFTLVTGYSIPLRAKVVTRWMELEEAAYAAPAAALPAPYAVPQSFAQALQLAADQAKLIEEQGERLTIAEPKAALVDRTFKAENGVSIRDLLPPPLFPSSRRIDPTSSIRNTDWTQNTRLEDKRAARSLAFKE
ncbi:MAG: Rha family transcriptional regulator [Hyphomicrobiales bacterium]|nr:Rha family transcriptional regulator [Hyphomicrobiales bacterium]